MKSPTTNFFVLIARAEVLSCRRSFVRPFVHGLWGQFRDARLAPTRAARAKSPSEILFIFGSSHPRPPWLPVVKCLLRGMSSTVRPGMCGSCENSREMRVHSSTVSFDTVVHGCERVASAELMVIHFRVGVTRTNTRPKRRRRPIMTRLVESDGRSDGPCARRACSYILSLSLWVCDNDNRLVNPCFQGLAVLTD